MPNLRNNVRNGKIELVREIVSRAQDKNTFEFSRKKKIKDNCFLDTLAILKFSVQDKFLKVKATAQNSFLLRRSKCNYHIQEI